MSGEVRRKKWGEEHVQGAVRNLAKAAGMTAAAAHGHCPRLH